ncbi:response regulator transcription factor [Opitutus sp. ER46]|uniref:response regulator transcription factor n=1 Tax=Opitutus sp. ER46 TaxID=2161864 RepID=UPI000D2FC74D|nr:response regulator transcription factor [Opitutus sp. ER46]PTX91548.1 DNA-binding response regulator [Opitutus sp. ER46]
MTGPTPTSKPASLDPTTCHFVVVEDESLLRDLLANSLSQTFAPAALHAFAEGRAALRHCLSHPVQLLLVDLGLPGLDGREVIRQVRARDARVRVIVLTAQADAALPAELIALGVAGFVDKGSPLEHAMRAVERVLAGGMYFFAGVMPQGSRFALHPSAPGRVSAAVLSARERDVARLVASGLTSKEIAQQLALSVRTVDNYRANVMQKVGVRDAVSLARWWLEQGRA